MGIGSVAIGTCDPARPANASCPKGCAIGPVWWDGGDITVPADGSDAGKRDGSTT